MLEIILIRHGATRGNMEKRYIGTTDEYLSQEGKDTLKSFDYPKVDLVYTSPMRRCIETAEIIYPDFDYKVVDLLRECDFGDFENKNYLELSSNPYYQKWIDSDGKLPFPSGESRSYFEERSFKGFLRVISKNEDKSIAIIAHGGTIMSILKRLSGENSFYEWHVENGNGYRLILKNKRLESVERLW